MLGAAALATLAAACGDVGTAQAAPRLTVLHSFVNPRGSTPVAGLIADGAGNLYGTTQLGGTNDKGVVFELTPPAQGKRFWTESALHSFSGADGDNPLAGLVADGAGNLYGTTYIGGANNDGVVFELSPPATGKTAWTEKVLHSFDGPNGKTPEAALIVDGAGNLYGTTVYGGNTYTGPNPGLGVVFELSPPAAGRKAWTETVIHYFDITDGYYPEAGLIADGAGNLYGTAIGGGNKGGYGVVFRLSPPAAGHPSWAETVLFSFDRTDGNAPLGGVIADGAGNLYGVTEHGGPYSPHHHGVQGVVYEISPPTAGKTVWTETVLKYFHGGDGHLPYGPLLEDGAGNLYGTTSYGGATYGQGSPGDGEVYELSPPAAGQTAWTEKGLVSFSGPNGDNPLGGLIADGAGNLYGTTVRGGTYGNGVVFRLTP
ncbi:MAG: choice-of-anchor tandem repeat GloVer-containing protein [Caulobacteraceae bacterium]